MPSILDSRLSSIGITPDRSINRFLLTTPLDFRCFRMVSKTVRVRDGLKEPIATNKFNFKLYVCLITTWSRAYGAAHLRSEIQPYGALGL
ncbi:hypothetical protein QTP88_024288 [Uroleucon formosanum]